MLSTYLSSLKINLIFLVFFLTGNLIVTDKAFATMDNTKQHCSITISSVPLIAEQVLINFSIENPFNKKMNLLMWYTPFEGFLSDLFIITSIKTGKQINYQGPLVKRLEPQVEDYLSLSANEVSSTTVNLSLAYAFSKGDYQLKLRNKTFYYQDENLTRFPALCEQSTISFSIL